MRPEIQSSALQGKHKNVLEKSRKALWKRRLGKFGFFKTKSVSEPEREILVKMEREGSSCPEIFPILLLSEQG